MAVICKKCGRRDDLCACGELIKEDARIVVRLERRPFTKSDTIIEGIDGRQSDFLPNMVKELNKSTFACGGNSKGWVYSAAAAGHHRGYLKGYFLKMGFSEDAVEAQ
jgi:translation initiation factor 1